MTKGHRFVAGLALLAISSCGGKGSTVARPLTLEFDRASFSAKLYAGPAPKPVLGEAWLRRDASANVGTVGTDSATPQSDAVQVQTGAERSADIIANLPLTLSTGKLEPNDLAELERWLPLVAATEARLASQTCDDACLFALVTFYGGLDRAYLRQPGFVKSMQTIIGMARQDSSPAVAALFEQIGDVSKRAAAAHRYVASKVIAGTTDRARLVKVLSRLAPALVYDEDFDLAAIAANEAMRDGAPTDRKLTDIALLGSACFGALHLACGEQALAMLDQAPNPSWDELGIISTRIDLRERHAAAKRLLATPAADVEAQLAAAEAELELSRKQAARRRLTQIAKDFPTQARAVSRLAEWEANFGDADQATIDAYLAKAQQGVGHDSKHYGFLFMQFYQTKLAKLIGPFLQDPTTWQAPLRATLHELQVILEGWAKVEPRGLLYLQALAIVDAQLPTLAENPGAILQDLYKMVKQLHQKYPADLHVTAAAAAVARVELGTSWASTFLRDLPAPPASPASPSSPASPVASEDELRLGIQLSSLRLMHALSERDQAALIIAKAAAAQTTAAAKGAAARSEMHKARELALLADVIAPRMRNTVADASAWQALREHCMAAARLESDAEKAAHLWNNAGVAAWALNDRGAAAEAWGQIAMAKLRPDIAALVQYNAAAASGDRAALQALVARDIDDDFSFAVARAAARRVAPGPLPPAVAGAQRADATVRNLNGDLGLVNENTFELGLGYSSRKGLQSPISIGMVGWLLLDAAGK